MGREVAHTVYVAGTGSDHPEQVYGETLVSTKLGGVGRMKEVTLNPVVYEWAFERRVAAIEEFLRAGHEVKVVIRPEPKQGSVGEASRRLLDRITARVVPDVATEASRKQDGTNWVMVLSPAD